MNFLGHSMISWEIDEKIDKNNEINNNLEA